MVDNRDFGCIYFSVFSSIYLSKKVKKCYRRTREIEITGQTK